MNDIRLAQYAIFYVAILLFFSVGAITTAGLDWYATLLLPIWAPGQTITAIIWLVLFLCTALSMAIFWGNATRLRASRLITFLYLGNAGLVLLWNYLFFGMQHLTAAFVAAVFVAITVLLLTVLLWNQSRSAALALVPYLIWMAFASVFSYQVLLVN